jgi:HEAT repeat protein
MLALSEKDPDHFGALKPRADEAIRHIGTNAIPCLLEWMRYNPSAWDVRLHYASYHLPSRLRPGWIMHDKKSQRANGAAWAFEALGTGAAQAIPDLANLITNSTAGDTAALATGALGFLGKDALPLLLGFLTNEGRFYLRDFASASIRRLGTNALPALPALIACLKDPNQTVAMNAGLALREMQLEPVVIVPPLLDMLQDSRDSVRAVAVVSLTRLRSDGGIAVPALLKLLEDPNVKVRDAAWAVLGSIDPEALPKAPAP